MEKDKLKLKKAKLTLEQMLERLDALEKEKKEILKRAKTDGVSTVKDDMQRSEEKFRLLAEEMLKLKDEVKKLKKSEKK